MDTIIVHPNGPIKSKIRFYWAIGKIFIPVNVFEYDCIHPKYAREMLFEWEFHFMNSKKGILLSSFVTHSLLGSLAAQAELGDAPKIYGLVTKIHPISGQT